MSKSRLILDIDLNVTAFKRRCRLILLNAIRKCCPRTLRNFDKKYPQLGGFKKDVTRLAYLVVVKATLVVIVIPVIVLVTLVESIKYLFKGK